MNNPLHEIDKLFRDGIESRSEYPPKNVWNEIESELDKDTVFQYKRKYISLKRKNSILVALFVVLVFYQEVKMYLNKETVQPANDTVFVNESQAPVTNIPVTPSVRDNSTENIGLDDNGVLKNNTGFYKQQPPGINTRSVQDRIIKNDPNSHLDQTSASAGDEGGWDFRLLQAETTVKEEAGFINTHIAPGRIKDIDRYQFAEANPLSSFLGMIADNSWRRDIAMGLEPASPVPPPGYITTKKSGHPAWGDSRYWLSVNVSPRLAWTTLNDERDDRRQPTVNNGGNIGGNNGGNIGGNNGGNNGGSNSGGSSFRTVGRGGRGDNRHEIAQDESESVAYSLGMKAGHQLSKKLSLLAGLNYQVNTTTIKPKLIFAGRDRHGEVGYRINCSSGYAFLRANGAASPQVGDSIMVNDTRNAVLYLGIPLLLEYKIVSVGKFSLSANTGTQVNLLLKGKTTSVFGKGTPNETTVSAKAQGLKMAYLSAIAGATAEMRVKGNLSLTLAPTGQFGLSYLNKEISVKTRLNSFGLAAGLKLRF